MHERSKERKHTKAADLERPGAVPGPAVPASPASPPTELSARFGHDFSQIRIHADDHAADTAAALDARAFTLGRDIVFGAGEYAPATTQGQRLLAHELAHAVQQGATAGHGAAMTAVDPSPALEAEAERVASDVALGHEPGSLSAGASPVAVQRAPRTLDPPAAPGASTADASAATPAPGGARAKVSEANEILMRGDVDRIADLLKQEWLNASDEAQIVRIIAGWADRDEPGGEATPHLDRFLVLLKGRAYSHSTFSSGWVTQHSIVYDDLWHYLEDDRLEQFKQLVARSRGEKTAGPGMEKSENLWHTLGKQEAVGLWGTLKGMGVGAANITDDVKWAIVKQAQLQGVNVEDPGSFADYVAKHFDESGDIMFGKDYTEGQELFLGLNAKDIGTGGGTLIWQLVMLGKGEGGAVQKLAEMAGSLHGVEKAATKIAGVVERMQQEPGGITAAKLVADPEFQSAMLELGASVYSALAGAGGGDDKAAKEIAARVQLLFASAQVLPTLGKLVSVWNSGLSIDEKKRQTGPILIELIQQAVAVGFSAKAYSEAAAAAAAPEQKTGGTEGAPAEADAAKQEATTEQPAKSEYPPNAIDLPEISPDEPFVVEGNEAGLQSERDFVNDPNAIDLPEPATEPTPSRQPTRRQARGPTFAEFDASEGLDLDRSDRSGGWPEPPRPDFGEPGGDLGGTGRGTGMHFNEFNPAEIVHGLRVEYDTSAGRPRSVEFRVDADVVDRQTQTERGFTQDASIPGPMPRDDSFTNTGTDRGHLAQREAFRGDADIERAVDQLSTVVPMTPELNRGEGSLWRRSEQRAIELAQEHGSVIVRVEPIYDANPQRLPDGTPIPKAIRRTILTMDGRILEDMSHLNQ